MELRLLSIGSASTLGSIPVAEIRRGLNKLVRDSGSKKLRAALIHDNDQGFIQFYSTETAYRGDFEREAPCHIQWCRHSGSGSEREHYFSDEVNFDQVVECFQLYAQGKEDWDQGISWEPYKEKKWSLMNPPGVVAGLAVGLSSFFLIPHFLEYGFSFESLIFIPPYALRCGLFGSSFPQAPTTMARPGISIPLEKAPAIQAAGEAAVGAVVATAAVAAAVAAAAVANR